ncbi:hypothetical protein HY632_02815 [Candidatus Uhrbacteria bacterium]|nr:hypothetical protein [Candidatus Uhrbacteria bacterium]
MFIGLLGTIPVFGSVAEDLAKLPAAVHQFLEHNPGAQHAPVALIDR